MSTSTDSTILLTTNLTTKEVTLGDGAWTPPVFTFGSQLTLAFRIVETAGATVIEPDLNITSTFAAVGSVDLPPKSRHFSLQIGEGASTVDNTTGPINYNASPVAVASAINALPAVVTAYGEAVVEDENGSWCVVFGEGTEKVPIQIRKNKLRPVSLLEVTATQTAGEWTHELRLMQAPVAACSIAERVLPPPPTITNVQHGGSGGDGSNPFPEVQELYVPPTFRGSYYLQRPETEARTGPIAQGATAEELKAALVKILGAGNVEVTAIDDTHARISFVGDLLGIDWLDLVATPMAPPPGPLTLTLTFDRAELLKRLRTDTTPSQPLLALPLHVRIFVTDEDDVTTPRDLLLQNIVFQRPVIWPALETVPSIDYARPLSPKDYVPFSVDTLIEGHKWNRTVRGNGTLEEFDWSHGLATEDVVVFVRENVAGGLQLANRIDFEVHVTNSASVRVTSLIGAPPTNGWAIYALSAQVAATFVNGLHITEGQVDGLVDDLTDALARIAAVEAQAATSTMGFTSTATAAAPVKIVIADKEDAFPVVGGKIVKSSGKVNLDALPRAGWLLPAIHDATVTSVGSLAAMPSIEAAGGNVYSNDTGAAITLDGGGGFRASSVAVGGFFGGDGRGLYALSREGSSSSFFPRAMEKTLFFELWPAAALRNGSLLALQWLQMVRLINATCAGQYLLVVEHGTVPSQSSPATTALNVSDIVWNATPLLSQQILLGEDEITWPYGIEVIHKANGDIAANQVAFSKAVAAGSTPAAGNLALRGRLKNFDTENGAVDATGIVLTRFSEALGSISYL